MTRNVPTAREVAERLLDLRYRALSRDADAGIVAELDVLREWAWAVADAAHRADRKVTEYQKDGVPVAAEVERLVSLLVDGDWSP